MMVLVMYSLSLIIYRYGINCVSPELERSFKHL